jgi:hypothetical protein
MDSSVLTQIVGIWPCFCFIVFAGYIFESTRQDIRRDERKTGRGHLSTGIVWWGYSFLVVASGGLLGLISLAFYLFGRWTKTHHRSIVAYQPAKPRYQSSVEVSQQPLRVL